MATADKVTVELEAKRGKFDRDITDARSRFQKEMGAIGTSAEVTERRIRASSDQIGSSLRGIAAGLATGATIGAITKLADGYTQLQNRLRVVGLEGQALEDVQNRLYEAGNRNGVAVGDLAQLYSRVALSAGELGATQSELLSLTDGVTAALRVQGVSAQEAAGPLLQLGQALGAGVVRAEEYNSIIEGVPVLAQAAAKGLDATGGSVAKLRTLVIDGKVSSEEFFRALLKGLPDVEKQAERSTLTIAQSFQALNNELGRYVGQTDQSLSASQRLSQGIIALSNNLGAIIPAIGVLVTLIGARYVAAGVAAVSTTIAQAGATALATQNARAHAVAVTAQAAANARLVASGGAATAALNYQAAASLSAAGAARAAGGAVAAAAGGPIGIAVLAVAALAAGLVILKNRYGDAAVAARELSGAQTTGRSALAAYEDAQIKARDASKEHAKAARDNADALREEAQAALQAASALVAKRLAEAKDAQARAKLASDNANDAYARAGTSEGSRSVAAGLNRTAIGAQDRLDRANEQLKEATDYRAELIEEFNRISAGIDLGGGGGRPPKDLDDGKKKKDNAAREAEQRRRLLEDLQAQTAIEEASLAQNLARVRELEREAEITARIRQLKDAGLSSDQAIATSAVIQARLDKARAEDRERIAEIQQRGVDLTVAEINENYDLVRSLERQEELDSLIEAHKKTTLSTTEAISKAEADLKVIEEARLYAAEKYLKTQQSSHALRIAELTGNERLVKQLRDIEEIEKRTAEYRDRGRLSPEQAREQATREVAAERTATEYGQQRDFFANTFSEGIRAAWAGDLQGFLSSQFGNLADMALKKIGESLFDSFASAPAAVAQAQVEGIAQGAAVSSVVGPAIVTSGTIAATEMGSAILAAGLASAQAMAAANAVSSFGIPGFANGTRSAPGGLAVVGERGPELVNLPRGSQVIPNHQLNGVGRNQATSVRLVIDESALFAARVEQISGPISVQTSTTGVLYSQEQATIANKRANQSFVR